MTLNRIQVLVEVPKGSQNKYAWDPEKRRIKLDRVLHSSIHYPADYGIIPGTEAPDGSPLDVLLLVTNPTFPGCVISGKVIGCLQTTDQGQDDLKIIAVPAHDPRLSQYESLDDVPPHVLREIEYFFKAYKDLEGKQVEIEGWSGPAEAMEAVRRMQV